MYTIFDLVAPSDLVDASSYIQPFLTIAPVEDVNSLCITLKSIEVFYKIQAVGVDTVLEVLKIVAQKLNSPSF